MTDTPLRRPGSPVLLGVLGSAAVAVGAWLTGRLAQTPRVHPLVVLQRASHVHAVGQVLLVAGLVVLSVAWWWLGRRTRETPGGLRWVLRAAGLWSLPLALTPPAVSGDAWSYVANSLLVRAGLSPYVVGPSHLSGPIVQAVSQRWRSALDPYGAVPLVWARPLAAHTSSPWLLLAWFHVLALVGLALLAWAVVRLARETGRDPATAAWIAAASPFTLVHGIASAHLDLLVAGLVAVALVLGARRRAVPAGLVLGLAAATKVSALVVVVPLALLVLAPGAGRRDRVRSAATVGATAVATLLAVGPLTGFGNGWVHGLAAPLSSLSPLSVSTQLGLQLSQLSGHDLLATCQHLGEAVLLGLAAWALLATPLRTPQVLRVGAWLAVAAAVLGPAVHLWYLLLAVPFLAVTTTTPAARRTVVSVLAGLALVAPLDASQHLPNSPELMRLGVVLALLAGLDVRWAHRTLTGSHDRATRAR